MSQPLRFVPFLGMMPRTAARLLPEGMAVQADNLDIASGEIRALKAPLLVHTPAGSGPWLSAYRPEWNGAEKWLTWTKDVDVVKAPLEAEVEPRYYWTGDNEPRFGTFSGLPSTIYSLGIPAPRTAPTVSHSGGTGSAVSRVYCYTYFSALGEESAPSPPNAIAAGKVDGTWAITGMDAFPANSTAISGTFASGMTTFDSTGSHWLRKGEEILLGSAKVVVAEVVDADTFKVAGDYSAATSWSRVAPWNTVGMKRRLYRSEGTNATFQLVADDVATNYNDTLTSAQILGDELISTTWELPPVGLRGMFVHPSGALGGFIGTKLRLSEPFQGHAWPLENEYGTDSEIIGVGLYGTSIVACTASRPYIFTGNDPESISADAVDEVWPCLSKRSAVAAGDGVVYATTHGYAYIGARGRQILTEGLFTRTEWEPLDPASMIAAVSEGKLFVRWLGKDGSRGIMVFVPSEPGSGMRRLADCPDELYEDPRNGKLYMLNSNGVSLYNAATGEKLSYSWRSKVVYLAQPANYGAVKVDFESEMSQADFDAAQAAFASQIAGNAALLAAYSGAGAMNRSQVNGMLVNGSNIRNIGLPALSSVTFSFYADGELKHARTLVGGNGFFRMPSGKKYSTAQIGLTGNTRIKGVRIATTPEELARIP